MSDVETKFVLILNNVAEHVINLEILSFQVDVLPDVLKYFVNLSNQIQNVLSGGGINDGQTGSLLLNSDFLRVRFRNNFHFSMPNNMNFKFDLF